MKNTIISILAIMAIGAACNIFTPAVDTSTYPCGDPRAQWCPGHTTCCSVDEICGTNVDGPWGCTADMCCPAGENFSVHPKVKADGGK